MNIEQTVTAFRHLHILRHCCVGDNATMSPNASYIVYIIIKKNNIFQFFYKTTQLPFLPNHFKDTRSSFHFIIIF